MLALRESFLFLIPVTIDRSANASIPFETYALSGEIDVLLKHIVKTGFYSVHGVR